MLEFYSINNYLVMSFDFWGGLHMTLRLLKIFIEVYRAENMTRAAEQLHMSQPAVTRAINEIENYYGIRLFERMHHRIYVTEVGKEFYASALHIVDSFDQMEMRLKNSDKFGLIRIGSTITMGNALLPKLLAEFRTRYPALTVNSLVTNGEQLQRLLLDNQLDFALIEGGIENDDLRQKKIGTDHLVLIVPPNDPRLVRESLSISELAEEHIIIGDKESAIRKYITHVFAAHGIPLRIGLETICTRSSIQSVHAGLGVSLLPECLVRDSIDSHYVATIPVYDESFTRDHYVVRHRQKYLTGSALEMIKRIEELSKEEFG